MYGELNKHFAAYPEFAGQTVQWLPSDTKEAFQKNMQTHPKQLKALGWTARNVDYTFNKYGMRCQEFTDEESLMVLGCSHAVGIGIPVEQTASYIAAKELGLANYNLGKGGGSNDTCFRLGSYWIPKLKPKYVVLLTPRMHRFELMSTDATAITIAPGYDAGYGKFYNKWVALDINSELSMQKNKLALQYICNQANSTFIEIDSDNLEPEDRHIPEYYDHARDLAHGGTHINAALAKDILQSIGNTNK